MKALVYKDETMGADYDVQDIPADMLEEAKATTRSWSKRSASRTTSCSKYSAARPSPKPS